MEEIKWKKVKCNSLYFMGVGGRCETVWEKIYSLCMNRERGVIERMKKEGIKICREKKRRRNVE